MVNFSDSDPSLGTIDVMKYVSQCEKRLSEQEQLISLLREKLLAYESTSTSSPSGGVAERPNTYAKAASGVRSDDSSTFMGCRKSDIVAVQTIRSAQFFVTRINPTVTAQVLTQDLMSYVTDLTSVKCSKIKTKHSSYSSFHLSVPEDQKQLVSSGEAWPEGVLVKPFVGKLLKTYILECYNSLHPDGAPSDEATIGDSPTSEDNSTSVKKPRAPPKKTTKEKSTKPTVPARGGGAAVAKTPEVNSSPKNSRPVRSTVTR
ncbi:hypothetical protein M8J77_018375 [Diaphorina citri]|jgi:hypothetical protein|nr:hypothetical protein M8J77_018375 [Diaphorina citri]